MTLDVWHLDVKPATDTQPTRCFPEGLHGVLQMLRDMKQRDEIKAFIFDGRCGEAADLDGDAERVA